MFSAFKLVQPAGEEVEQQKSVMNPSEKPWCNLSSDLLPQGLEDVQWRVMSPSPPPFQLKPFCEHPPLPLIWI